jgi:transposase
LVSRRTATINQIRAFLIEQGIAVRVGPRALRNSLFAILENRKDEVSPRMANLILGLYQDWCQLDERIGAVTGEIEKLSQAVRDTACAPLWFDVATARRAGSIDHSKLAIFVAAMPM